MQPFSYEPSDTEIAKLAVMTQSEGWQVFCRLMDLAVSQIGILALDAPENRPTGYYKGYADSLRETAARVDEYINKLKAERQAENEATRLRPARPASSSGDTAS